MNEPEDTESKLWGYVLWLLTYPDEARNEKAREAAAQCDLKALGDALRPREVEEG